MTFTTNQLNASLNELSSSDLNTGYQNYFNIRTQIESKIQSLSSQGSKPNLEDLIQILKGELTAHGLDPSSPVQNSNLSLAESVTEPLKEQQERFNLYLQHHNVGAEALQHKIDETVNPVSTLSSMVNHLKAALPNSVQKQEEALGYFHTDTPLDIQTKMNAQSAFQRYKISQILDTVDQTRGQFVQDIHQKHRNIYELSLLSELFKEGQQADFIRALDLTPNEVEQLRHVIDESLVAKSTHIQTLTHDLEAMAPIINTLASQIQTIDVHLDPSNSPIAINLQPIPVTLTSAQIAESLPSGPKPTSCPLKPANFDLLPSEIARKKAILRSCHGQR